jgi:hypothetical protein
MLTVRGSGTSGNPVLIQFTTGAELTAPYWSSNNGTAPTSGAITINGYNYITVDGGSNGLITSTADGTALTYQEMNVGIYVSGSSGIEIRNLTINNIYLRTGTGSSDSSAAGNSADIWFAGNTTNASIHGCTLSDAHGGIEVEFDNSTVSGFTIYNNTVSHHAWGIQFGSGSDSEKATGISVYGNTVTNWNDWADVNATYHTDGIFFYAGKYGVGGSITPSVYNNYLYGDLGGGIGISPVTSFIYCSTNALCSIFNNVIVDTGNDDPWGMINIGAQAQSGSVIYNNTIVAGGGGSLDIGMAGSATTSLENNIFAHGTGIAIWPNTFSSVAFADYDDYYSESIIALDNNSGTPNYVTTLSAWQGSPYNHEAHGTTGNPLLNGSEQPQSGSAAIGLGSNLTSLCSTLPALCYDKNGVLRSATAAWDAGAYVYTATPTNLSAVPH